MVLAKRKGDSTAATHVSQWIAVILILATTSAGNGLSTTPTTDDAKAVLASDSSNNNNNSSRSSKISFNSTRTFLQKQPSLVASSTSTATSKSLLETSFHNINSLSASISKSTYYRAATNTHTTANDNDAADDVNQHLVGTLRNPSHYGSHDNDNNEDNHHLNSNDSQNISIASWGNSKHPNSSDSSSSSSSSSRNSSKISSNGGNNSRMRNTNDNNKRRSIQHQPHEPDINQNHIDGGEATSSAVPKSAGEIYFGTENFTTITTQIGSVVVIPCTVYNIDEETISWIRRKDYHLLTVDSTTYSGDARFNTIHIPDSKDWTLQIKYVQSRDAGLYECQVSTHPPTSTFTRLNVVEASAHIPGPMERYLKPGSTLKLICKVLQSLEAPLYLFWYHNSRMINYDLHRGINVTTDLDNRVSELTIYQASTTRSGNYSCVPSNAVPASTFVHILYGENPAAMQHGDTGTIILVSPILTLLVTLVTYQSIRLS